MLKWLKINPKFVFYTLLALTCLFTISVKASNLLEDKQNAIAQGGNQESWLSEAFSSNAVAGLQALVGPIPNDVIEGKKTTWIPGGAIGTVSQAIAFTYTPVASGVGYIAQTWDTFLGKPIYAQGDTGFQGLQPLLPLWRGFRNVVYILASLIFIIIGIMIMLRVKISPQAVITVQNAIPQLITTLILVTFSYAIAGLLIDLMSVLQGAILTALFAATGKGLTSNLLSPVLFTGTDYNSLNNLNLAQIFLIITKNIALWAIMLIGILLGGAIGALLTGPTTAVIPIIGVTVGTIGGAAIGSILFALIVIIIIFMNVIKFFFGLVKTYVNILFHIILAPLEIGVGAFPGSKQGFSSWIYDLIGHLAVFPISILFIVMINMIAESTSGSLWAPGVVGSGGFLGLIVAFGGLLMLPSIPELVPQVFFNLKPSPWDQAAAKGFQPISNFASAAGGLAVGGGLAPLVGTGLKNAENRWGGDTQIGWKGRMVQLAKIFGGAYDAGANAKKWNQRP